MSFGGDEEPSTLATNHQHHHHLLDWLEDSITFLPSFLDDPYTVPNAITAPSDITAYEWWTPDLDQAHVDTPLASATPEDPVTTITTTISTDSNSLSLPELSKKRKPLAAPVPANHHNRRRITAEAGECGEGEQDDEVQRKPGNGRKATGKGAGGSSASGSSKEVRWAEQLLNPCASAVDSGNLSRVQHLLYVLQELASPSGDVNHRLATHGLRALTHHLSSSGTSLTVPAAPPAPSFASTEPRLFRAALIRFHEVSPWFAFPNALANSSILNLIADGPPRSLHVIDIGVSHGVQWPTLLEATTRRPSGAPPLIRLTIAGAAAAPAPFSAAPPGGGGRVLEEEEGRERWRERMIGAGFIEEGFGEEAMDAGRALLKKYDGNWEMRPAVGAVLPPSAAAAVGLWWKGQPVSFCSFWKPVSSNVC